MTERNIWVMWWQGLEEAPELVKICINSIKINSMNRKVNIITKDNYFNFITLPEHITKKFEEGYITITHLSDIIRMNLLYNYGGFWIDATVLTTRPIEDKIFEKDFFSTKGEWDFHGVSNSRWMGFLIASKPKNLIIEKCLKFLYKYWINEKKMVDYLLIDYVINIIYEEDETARKMIDENTVKEETFYMISKLNHHYSESLYKNIVEKAQFHKLSWHYNYALEIEGKKTVYGFLKKKYGRNIKYEKKNS